MAREFQPEQIKNEKDIKTIMKNFENIKTSIREINAAIEELKKPKEE